MRPQIKVLKNAKTPELGEGKQLDMSTFRTESHGQSWVSVAALLCQEPSQAKHVCQCHFSSPLSSLHSY